MWSRPFKVWFVTRELELTTINLCTKFEVFVSIRYEDMKGDAKCRIWGGLGSYGSYKVTGNITIRYTAYDEFY